MIRCAINFIISSLQNVFNMYTSIRLHVASVKWRYQLLLAAVLMNSEQHIAVCSSSDQPEIERVLGIHDPSSIPKARSHMDSGQDLAGQGFGKLPEIMRSSLKISRSRR